jgi:hypothetical protein
MCRRKFGLIAVVIIFICINLLMLARNDSIYVHLNFSGAKASCLLSKGVFLVIRASEHCWVGLKCVGCLKECKLD